jgi:phosphoribosylformimino-5-aminoimidazole carboxamide ribotide isomerase
MDLYARVNIMDGRSVRLPRGDVREAIALDNDPLGRARSWVAQGADYVHIVDLNAAAHGDYQNRPLIDRIITEIEHPVQVAGGIRSHVEAARLLDLGAWRIVMGTAAIEDQNMIWELCRDFPGRVAVAIDVRPDHELATRGWTRNSGRYLEGVLIELSSAGVTSILVAEAGRDALAEPPDYSILAEALATVQEPVIAAGGVRNLDDLHRIMRLEMNGRKLAGIIVGREVTHGRFTIPEAKEVLAGGGQIKAPGQIAQHRTILNVSNFGASVAFYEGALGFSRVSAWDEETGPGIILQTGEQGTIELFGAPVGALSWDASSNAAMAFYVADLQAWHDHLVASGIPIVRGLLDNPWGDRSFAVEDPDGTKVWFAQLL